MSKMFKKSCSLVLAVALLLSMAVVNVLAGDSAETGLTVEQIEGNILTDGSFENGASGWSAENATVTKTMDETYGDTAGAGKVTRDADGGYIYQNVSVRKYTWYTYSARVKMAEGTANASIALDYGTDDWNTTATQKILSENTAVNAEEWTELKGYFVRVNETSAQTEDTDVADYFLPAKVSLAVSGSADYYVDEFKIVALEGMYNGDFSDGTEGWNVGSTSELEMNVLGDGVNEVSDGEKALGADTTGKYVMKVTASKKNLFLETAVCIEKNVVYEITAKVKADTVKSGDYIYIRTSKAALTNSGEDSDSPYIGKTQFTDGKWSTLKTTFKYVGDNPYTYLDFRLQATVNGTVITSGGNEYYIMDFELKKKTNILDNPYFESHLSNKTNKYGVADGWLAGGDSSATAEDFSASLPADTIGTYDNSNSRLKFVPGASGTKFTERSIRQQQIALEEGRKYDISVWLRREGTEYTEGEPRKFGFRARHSYPKDDGSGNTTKEEEILAATNELPTSWQNITVENYEFNLPENYVELSDIGIDLDSGASTEAIYLQDFFVTPVYEAPVVESASIGSAAAGFALSAPTLTVEESPDGYSYRYRYILYDNENSASGKTVISGHTNVGESIGSSNVPSDWKNKYLALEITPVSDKGVWGESFLTEKVLVEEAYTITPNVGNGYTGEIEAEGTITANVTVKNNDATNTLPVAVIIAYFENGRLVAANLEDKEVANGSPETFTPSVTLPKTLGENPSVKVFVWKGYDGESFKMQPLTEAYPKN